MKRLLVVGLLLTLSACSAATPPPPTNADPATPISTTVPAEEAAAEPETTEPEGNESSFVSAAEDETTEAEETQPPADEQPVEGETAPEEPAFAARPHRAAPAPEEVFVNDQPQYVGSTGLPQLVEFFTDW